MAGADVVTAPDHHQPFAGRQHRFEHGLAHVPPGVPVPETGGEGRQVVPVHRSGREGTLVHAEEDDHPVRDPLQGGQRRDGDTPPEEVGASGSAAQPGVDDPTEVGEADRRGRAPAFVGGTVDDGAEHAVELLELPLEVRGGGEQVRNPADQEVDPPVDRPPAAEPALEVTQRAEELGQSTGQIGAIAGGLEGRHVTDRQAEAVGLHHRPHQQLVDPRLPGVGGDVGGQLELGPVTGVETPPDVGGSHPPGDPGQVLGGEAEPLAHRAERREVEHRGGLEAAAQQGDQVHHGLDDRVGGAEGAVRDPVAQRRGPTVRAGRGRPGIRRRAEDGLDHRREPVEGRAEHRDVVLAEPELRVGQEVEDGVPGHLDLAGGPVAGMELHRAVGRVRLEGAARHPVGPDVGLEFRQDRPGAGRSVPAGGRAGGEGLDRTVGIGEQHRRLAVQAPPRPEQGVGDRRRAVVLRAEPVTRRPGSRALRPRGPGPASTARGGRSGRRAPGPPPRPARGTPVLRRLESPKRATRAGRSGRSGTSRPARRSASRSGGAAPPGSSPRSGSGSGPRGPAARGTVGSGRGRCRRPAPGLHDRSMAGRCTW